MTALGIASREYFSRDAGGNKTPASNWLLGITIAVFVAQLLFLRDAQIEDLPREVLRDLSDQQRQELEQHGLGWKVSIVQKWLELDPDLVVFHGQIWRLLTHAFCHNRTSIFHILFNMLFLFWFGRTLEAMYGSREFLVFYLTAAVVASLAYLGLGFVTGGLGRAIGASGAVMAVMALYAIHFPRNKVLLFMVIPIEIRWLVLLYVVYDLHPFLRSLAGDDPVTGVAHTAHLGGLAFGFAYHRFGLRLSSWLDRAARHRSPASRPMTPAPTRFDAEVDRLLQKVKEKGLHSLTDSEREFLTRASDRYRKRPDS